MPYKMWFHTKYRSTSIDKVNLRSTVNSGFLTFPTARPLDMSFCVVLGTRNFSGEKKCSDNNWRTLNCRWLNQQYQEEKIYLKLLSKNNLQRQICHLLSSYSMLIQFIYMHYRAVILTNCATFVFRLRFCTTKDKNVCIVINYTVWLLLAGM